MMTSAAISRFLEKNIGQIFKKNLEVQKKLSYPQMCREDTTDTAFKRYDTVGNITEATVKGEGQPIKYDEFKQGYETIIHTKTVAKGVHISMEASEDDLYGVVDTGKGAQLMRAINTAKEKAVANLFNTAFTGTGADGKAYAAADHPLLNSTSVNDNLATGSFTPANYIAAYNKFNGIKDQAGGVLDTTPTKLVTHINKQFAVAEVLESALKALENTNTKNVVPAIACAFSKYLTINLTTGVAPWFLIDEDYNPFILLKKRGHEINVTQDKKDTLDFYCNINERYGTGIITPGYGFVGSLGAD